MYPDNWVLDEQDAIAGNRSVTVYSPGGAFWSIALYEPQVDLNALTIEAMQSLKTEYEGAEAEPAADEVGEYSLKGYNVYFFYLDLTNTALIRGVCLPGVTCLVLCQAEDREMETAGPVFRAITTSLLSDSPTT